MAQIKGITTLLRSIFNIVIFLSCFYSTNLIQQISGPFTHSFQSKKHLIIFIIPMQIIKAIYGILADQISKVRYFSEITRNVQELLTIKYIIILVFKICLIFNQQHRKKFYLHTFFIEAFIITISILLDCFKRNNIKEAGQLLILQPIHRLSVIYELTQTFSPNLILYYSITNLLLFIVSQIESQQLFGLKKSLYVKNDIYRFIFLSLVYFAIISIAQLSSYGFKMLITFGLCLNWYLQAFNNYNSNKFKQAKLNLFTVGMIMMSVELIYMNFLDG